MTFGLRIVAAGWIASAALGLAAAGAHHSTSMYDSRRQVTIRGEVKRLNWANPHVMLVMTGAPSGEPPREWLLEMSSPGVMTREGWTKRSLEPGDKVTVVARPLRNGAPGGSLRTATLDATGEVFRRIPDVADEPNLE